MTGLGFVLVTTFLASTVEAIEMVTIVVGVGATRGGDVYVMPANHQLPSIRTRRRELWRG
jgi:uncharacterized membrane protein